MNCKIIQMCNGQGPTILSNFNLYGSSRNVKTINDTHIVYYCVESNVQPTFSNIESTFVSNWLTSNW